MVYSGVQGTDSQKFVKKLVLGWETCRRHGEPSTAI